MFNALKDYFLLPLLKVSGHTIISVATFKRDEIDCNLTVKLPLILKLGWQPFVRKFWLKWYKMSDFIQYNIFGVFDPGTTAKRILKNSFCPLPEYVVIDYYNDVSSVESCIKRIKNRT
jgi:hypothetical protein